MAEIVLAIGTSHTPLLALDGERWGERGADDMKNPALVLTDGRTLSYDALEAERGPRFADQCTVERFSEIDAASQRALDRMADQIEAADVDVVVVIGDDQDELFGKDNIPAFAIYYGDEVVMHPKVLTESDPNWRVPVRVGYAMDEAHRFPGAPNFAEFLICEMIERDVDVGAARTVPDPEKYGFGHAFGFVVKRLFRERAIPMVPVLLNTYFPPNAMTPKRCYDVGIQLRKAIESYPDDLRVAVIASGGLSHFVTDAELDERIIAALIENDRATLSSVPVDALLSGSSEIRNWIMLGGLLPPMTHDWSEYYPIYRTPAGTGVGAGFAVWRA